MVKQYYLNKEAIAPATTTIGYVLSYAGTFEVLSAIRECAENTQTSQILVYGTDHILTKQTTEAIKHIEKAIRLLYPEDA